MDDEDGGTRRDTGPITDELERASMTSTSTTPTDVSPDEAPAARGAASNFDPTPYLRQLRGRGGQGQDYLDVKWRLLWLRREHPDAQIVTEHVRIDEGSAIFKATVTLPTGGKASGYGSETAGDFGDFIEKAETKAIGRALNALGYGAQFAEETDEPAPVRPPYAGPPPAPPSPRPAAPAPSQPPARPRPAAAASTPAAPAPASPSAAPPIDFVASRERAAAPASAASAAPTAPAQGAPPARPAAVSAPTTGGAEPADAEPDLADYSWTAFWPWAKQLGYGNRAAVEEVIGRPIAGLSPADLRDAVRAAHEER